MTPLHAPASPTSLTISTDGLGRRFGRHWIFRNLTTDFRAGEPTAILGPNGTGKSTLLSVLAGWLPSTEGSLSYSLDGKSLEAEHLYRHTALAAPYLDLPDDLTVLETATWQGRLKPWRPGIDGPADVVAQARLDGPAADRRVRALSSGMRQRLRLALALLSDARFVLLDEPTANLDRAGIDWYHALIARTCQPDRLVLVASNVAEEYAFCSRTLHLPDYAAARRPAD